MENPCEQANRLCCHCRQRSSFFHRFRVTVTLAVKNMYCADCPFIVQKSLEAVPGVSKTVVSYKDKTAVVTYDDSRADVAALTHATTEAGYPSAPRS